MSSAVRSIVWVQIVSAPGMIRSKLKVIRPMSSLTGIIAPRLSNGVAASAHVRMALAEAVRIDSGLSWKRCCPSVSGRPMATAVALVTSDGR